MQNHDGSGLARFASWLLLSDLSAGSASAPFFVWFWRLFLGLGAAVMALQLIWFHTVGLCVGFALLLLFMTLLFRLLLKYVLRVARNDPPASPALPRRSRSGRVALGVVGVIVLAVAMGLYFTRGLSEAADGFLTAARASDLDRAHAFLSERFEAATKPADLKAFLDSSGLSQYASASWTSRSIQNDRGELEGTVTTHGGGSIPLRIYFVREHGAWKIFSIQKPTAGLRKDSEPQDAGLRQ